MNSYYSPAQHVPTTPSLTSERFQHHGQGWWESPSAVVPDTDDLFDNPGTPSVLVPRTPQHPFARSPWSTPLHEGRGTTPTFTTPSSADTPTRTLLSRTTPISTTPFSRTRYTVATPVPGVTPVPTRGQSHFCKDPRRTSYFVGEQIVPFTPKLNEAATPTCQAWIPPAIRETGGEGRKTPRVLLSPQNVPPDTYRHLDLFSGDDYFD